MKVYSYIFMIVFMFMSPFLMWAQDRNVIMKEVDSLNKKAWKSRVEDASQAVKYSIEALNKGLAINYQEGIVKSYSYLGVAYRNEGKYTLALEQFFEALKISDAYELQTDLAYSHINIANIYYLQLKFKQAEQHLNYALKIAHKIKDRNVYSYIYINYARVFRKQKQYKKALKYINSVLKIRKKYSKPVSMMAVYAEKGKIYRDMGKYTNAIYELNEALYIALQHKYTLDVIIYYHHIARTYFYFKNYRQAKHYARMSLMLHPEIVGIHLRQNNYDILAKVYKETKEYDKALKYFELWARVQDSIKIEEYNESLNKMQIQYNARKKEQENEVLREQNEKQSLMMFAVILLAVLLLCIVYLLYKNNRRRRQHNHKLREQQKEILASHSKLKQKNQEIQQKSNLLQQANDQIQDQNVKITSSINYAKRIQQAVLPQLENIQKYLPQSFIFYRPRDIVSGDFYFFDTIEDSIIISAIDCTGHGVPGAFMSLIANDLLGNIILSEKNISPDKILNSLHLHIKSTLRQDLNQGQDGMDMALCIIRPTQNILEFSGAKNPLFYIQNNSETLIKGDIMPIGGYNHHHKQRQINRQYTKHSISFDAPTTFYIYSDGFQDQFGGEKGKKFMSRKFRELLTKAHQEPIQQQGNFLEKKLDEWTNHGAYHQVDDILVIGFKLYPTENKEK